MPVQRITKWRRPISIWKRSSSLPPGARPICSTRRSRSASLNTQALADRHVQSLARSRRRRRAVVARRDLRSAPVGADRRHPRHRAVRRQPDRARPGRRRLYRRRLSRPPAGPQRRACSTSSASRCCAGRRALCSAATPKAARVSIVTKAPTGVFGVRASAPGVGNFGSYNGEVHLDLPAFANFAVKLDGVIEHQDATTENPARRPDRLEFLQPRRRPRRGPLDAVRRLHRRTSPTIAASDENTPFYSQLVNYNPLNRYVGVYDRTANRLVGAAGNVLGAATAGLHRAAVAAGRRQRRQSDGSRRNRRAAAAERRPVRTASPASIKYNASPALELRSITAWRGVTTHQWDNSGGAHRTDLRAERQLQPLQPVRAPPEPVQPGIPGGRQHPARSIMSFGAYYFNEHVSRSRGDALDQPLERQRHRLHDQQPVRRSAPITSGNQGWDPISWFVQRASRADGARAIRCSARSTWTPEVRHPPPDSRAPAIRTTSATASFTRSQNMPTNFVFTLQQRTGSTRWSRWRSTPSPDIHLYAKYATGYRAGGANDRSQTFTAFGPESVKSYELGAKLDLLDTASASTLPATSWTAKARRPTSTMSTPIRRARPSTCTRRKPATRPGRRKSGAWKRS